MVRIPALLCQTHSYHRKLKAGYLLSQELG
jgi:hypothetical protein